MSHGAISLYQLELSMTSIQEFNKNLYNFIDKQYSESIDELMTISEELWYMLGETPEQFCIEQEITFS